MEHLIFWSEPLLLIIFWLFSFFHPFWYHHLFWGAFFTFSPFILGCLFQLLNLYFFSAQLLQTYHSLLYFTSLLTAFFLLLGWYKFLWLILTTSSIQNLSDLNKIIFTALFSLFMVSTVILLFAFYYLWTDAFFGFQQGLRSVLDNYQFIYLDFPTAFYFSFVCYFGLGFGDFIPCGPHFQFLVFLECLLSLLNTAILLFYTFHFLFSQEKRHP